MNSHHAGDRKTRSPIRHLKPDELELWRAVARTTQPLQRKPAAVDRSARGLDRSVRAASGGSSTPAVKTFTLRSSASTTGASGPLSRKELKRLANVRFDVGSVLDLHGCTQEQAYLKLRSFLSRSISRGVDLALIITGKGDRISSDNSISTPKGILRRSVPAWLQSPAFQPFVRGYSEAVYQHGGAGALYVRLRRTPRNS